MTAITYPTHPQELFWMSPLLRWEDRCELETVSGLDAGAALIRSYIASAECVTFRPAVNAPPVAIFGVAPSPYEGYGAVWLVATNAVQRHRLALLAECRAWRDDWATKYSRGLHNLVDSRNGTHLKWLKTLGFTFGHTADVNGAPFIYTVYTPERSSSVV